MSTLFHQNNLATLRLDEEAVFIFLPQNRKIYFAPVDDYQKLINFYSKKNKNLLPDGYEKLLSNTNITNSCNTSSYGLGGQAWNTIPLPDKPLIINWMITGMCNHKCIYCYAQDLMDNGLEPTEETISATLEKLKEYQPLAVAVSGGEPTLSPYFNEIVSELCKFTSVIVDTNASQFSNEILETLVNNNIHVRISLDSHRKQIHTKTKTPKEKKFFNEYYDNIIKNIDFLTKKNIAVTIHTVATVYNYRDITELVSTLKNFNVSEVSIRLVEKSKSIRNYNKLIGPDKTIERFITQVLKRSDLKKWTKLSKQYIRNSIIIISPDGKFYTESLIPEIGKIEISDMPNTAPNIHEFKKKIDMHAHALRYITK